MFILNPGAVKLQPGYSIQRHKVKISLSTGAGIRFDNLELLFFS